MPFRVRFIRLRITMLTLYKHIHNYICNSIINCVLFSYSHHRFIDGDLACNWGGKGSITKGKFSMLRETYVRVHIKCLKQQIWFYNIVGNCIYSLILIRVLTASLVKRKFYFNTWWSLLQIIVTEWKCTTISNHGI